MDIINDLIEDVAHRDNRTDELWDKLIQEIMDGNVIPVIGAGLLSDYYSDLHKYIVNNKLGKALNINEGRVN